MGIVVVPQFGADPVSITGPGLDAKVDGLATEFNGSIDNDNIASGAGIVYSKLTLTGQIVNADINASAAIADTKLATISTANKVAGGAVNINGLSAVTAVGTDYMMIADTSDSNNPKKALVSDVAFTPSVSNAISGSVIQTVSNIGDSTFGPSANLAWGAVASGAVTTPALDDTIPQNSEGILFMQKAITPNNASNKLLIMVQIALANDTQVGQYVSLFQDTTADALATATMDLANVGNPHTLVFYHIMAAGTTSATTFKVRAGAGGGTITMNGTGGNRKFGGVFSSFMTIQEIKA